MHVMFVLTICVCAFVCAERCASGHASWARVTTADGVTLALRATPHGIECRPLTANDDVSDATMGTASSTHETIEALLMYYSPAAFVRSHQQALARSLAALQPH